MTVPPPASFSQFMEEALYAPGRGFYERGGQAGRSRGDFLTSPEVGPLWGAVLACVIDAWWEERGRPDPFLVDEHGAGPGTLARTVLVAKPECIEALRWTLIERSGAQSTLHPDGPHVASAAERPDRPAHVIVANELLDNLPFDLFDRTGDGWREVRVGPSCEQLHDATHDDASLLAELAPDAPLGARAPLQPAAGEWVASSLAQLHPGGRLLVIDYASTTEDLAARPWREWLRTYAGHGPGTHPVEAPGTQDITVEVCVDQLARAARPPDRDRTQAEFLHAWGIDTLVEQGERHWRESGLTDLDALRARSRATEAQALCDPAGLGAFRVLEWHAP